MKVFIAGSTGVLGRELVRQFRSAGHEVIGVARSEEKASLLRNLDAAPVAVDVFDPEALARAAEGCQVVIHAATSIPTKSRTKRRDWETNDRLRREGTRALTKCAAKIGAHAYLQQSIVWVAAPTNGAEFDETAVPNPDPIAQSAWDGEEIAQEMGQRSGFAAMVLRCGMFYSPEAPSTRTFGELLVQRKLPILGKGDAILSVVHVEDAATSFLAAANWPRAGVWHIVDDERVSVSELLTEFAKLLDAPAPRRVPLWLARCLADSNNIRFLTRSVRTGNRKFRAEFGWKPQYPTFREGLAHIVSRWREEGFLIPEYRRNKAEFSKRR